MLTNEVGVTTAVEAAGRVQVELDELFRLDDEDASEVLLVRHAEPARSLEGASSPDPLLSCQGLEQAERLALRLDCLWLQAVFSAPERRCYQTAKIVADDLQRPLQVLDGLADIDIAPARPDGPAACGPMSDQFVRTPRWDSLSIFEKSSTFRRRAVLAIERLVAANPARRIVVVTHSSVINAYLSMVLGVPADMFFTPEHASISVLRQCGELYAVRSLNDTAHLGWAAGAMD